MLRGMVPLMEAHFGIRILNVSLGVRHGMAIGLGVRAMQEGAVRAAVR